MTFEIIEKVLYQFIAPSEVDNMTISQILNAINGYYENKEQQSKLDSIRYWEGVRWQTWVLFNVQVGKKNKISRPEKLIKFEWDKKSRITEEERERLRQINDKFPKYFNNGNK